MHMDIYITCARCTYSMQVVYVRMLVCVCVCVRTFMRAYAGARGMTPQRLRPCMCDAAQAAKRFSTLRANPACGSLSWCPRSCLRRNRGAALTQTASLSRLPSHGAGPDACVAPGRCHALILCVRARLRAAAADLAPPGCRGAAARRHPDAVHITDAARCLCRWGVCPRWACPAAEPPSHKYGVFFSRKLDGVPRIPVRGTPSKAAVSGMHR